MTQTATNAPEKAALTFTDAAASKVKRLIEEENNPALMLRVFISGGGCSGWSPPAEAATRQFYCHGEVIKTESATARFHPVTLPARVRAGTSRLRYDVRFRIAVSVPRVRPRPEPAVPSRDYSPEPLRSTAARWFRRTSRGRGRSHRCAAGCGPPG